MLSAGTTRLAAACVVALAAGACSDPRAGAEPPSSEVGALDLEAALVGRWRGVLESPGGELPFDFVLDRGDEGLAGAVVNGEERAPFSSVGFEGDRVVLAFDWYDSRITASLLPAAGAMTGEWTRTHHGGTQTRMPFRARRGHAPRFGPLDAPPGDPSVSRVGGVWAATFVDEDGSEPARAELHQEGERVLGTFLTPTGDYRFLDGSYADGVLRLSTFDGAHAFLFTARARPDGTLAGDFHSRETYHATWTAERIDPATDVLPDAWQEVGLTNSEGRLSFSFPDLDGNPVSLDDPRFDGKVVIVNIFGSWCPNCNDEAPLLADWHRRYRDRGLEVVGLAYEFTGDPERDRTVLRRYADRHGIDYPLLLAGTSDKQAAAATLPDLTRVVAYPTTIFIDRRGKVAEIHSGFAGPRHRRAPHRAGRRAGGGDRGVAPSHLTSFRLQ